ncbi:hypothetical protein CXB51_031162 [Gossypium anomalum]|uniref:Uncharacterized protein n=1 Tax=Gossypium anomalum TaxID=47600 RepID=A0A8J5YBE4_9ROSI|nr:hypothetical protein CXB51_031162 [Gossypium anomalum]
MFQFARLSLICPWIQHQFERLTYSGISESTLIFNSPKHFVTYYALLRLWVPRYPTLFGLSSQVEDKRTRTANICHKDSCGSGGSCYKRTKNGGELSPSDSLILKMVLWSINDPWISKTSLGLSHSFYGVETMGNPRWGNLGESPTSTTVDVQSILNLTNRPSYLFYVVDSPSLSQ